MMRIGLIVFPVYLLTKFKDYWCLPHINGLLAVDALDYFRKSHIHVTWILLDPQLKLIMWLLACVKLLQFSYSIYKNCIFCMQSLEFLLKHICVKRIVWSIAWLKLLSYIYLWCAVHFPVIHWNLVRYISSIIFNKSYEVYFTFNFLFVSCILEILLFLFASHDLILIGHELFEERNLQGAPIFSFFFFLVYYLISKKYRTPRNLWKRDKFESCWITCVWHCGQSTVCQKFDFFLLKIIIIIFMFKFLDYFDVLMLKMNFLKMKKHYLDAFSSEKHFEK
jgi:hypothetical protein